MLRASKLTYGETKVSLYLSHSPKQYPVDICVEDLA